MDLSPSHRTRLSGLLARGELVLFTGAGFSVGATDSSGRHLPTSAELCLDLWQIAFPGSPFDPASALGEVFECALRTARRATIALLKSRFAVDEGSLPAYYRTWLSQPWLRIYSLNVDTLDEAATRHFSLPRPIISVSAITSSFPDLRTGLYSIHLNGKFSDIPDVTFSPPQYGTRLATTEPWYQTLIADITARPVLFVGSELDESLLWQHMAMRNLRHHGERELRPGSYLISPSIPVARRALLENYNISWIAASAEDFANEVLTPLKAQSDSGLRRIAERQGLLHSPLLESVAELRTEVQADVLHEFLLGRAPTWGDLVHGYAITRRFELELPARIADGPTRITVLTGTAGCGKSTSLMGVALALQAAGRDVWWMDPFSWPEASHVRTALHEHLPQVLVIDDLNRLGDAALDIMRSAIDTYPDLRIVAAARSTKTELSRLEELAAAGHAQTITVPPLEDHDIDELLAVLDKANRLGVLKGLSVSERRKELRYKCGRQLLVAMIEATSGERFEEKIASECRDLSGHTSLLYAVVASATSEGFWLSRDECLDAGGIVSNEALVAFRRLTDAHLIVEMQGRCQVRHPVIAERAVAYYTGEGQIVDPIAGLAEAISQRVFPGMERRVRERRLLNRLINHEWLFRHTKIAGARRVHQAVESSLEWDWQFWLQRGRSELEHGSLRFARNFLGQAVSLAPGDLWVRAAWSQLVIQEATASDDPGARAEDVAGALSELEDIIQAVGHRETRPFHVLGLRGMLWVHKAALSRADRISVLLRLKRVVSEGCALHPEDSELAAVSNQLQREYLMTAVEGHVAT